MHEKSIQHDQMSKMLLKPRALAEVAIRRDAETETTGKGLFGRREWEWTVIEELVCAKDELV
jgi:hypothetical protein